MMISLTPVVITPEGEKTDKVQPSVKDSFTSLGDDLIVNMVPTIDMMISIKK